MEKAIIDDDKCLKTISAGYQYHWLSTFISLVLVLNWGILPSSIVTHLSPI